MNRNYRFGHSRSAIFINPIYVFKWYASVGPITCWLPVCLKCDMMTMRDEYVNIMFEYCFIYADTVFELSWCDQPRLKTLCVEM